MGFTVVVSLVIYVVFPVSCSAHCVFVSCVLSLMSSSVSCPVYCLLSFTLCLMSRVSFVSCLMCRSVSGFVLCVFLVSCLSYVPPACLSFLCLVPCFACAFCLVSRVVSNCASCLVPCVIPCVSCRAFCLTSWRVSSIVPRAARQIGDRGAQALASALPTLKLETLDLGFNNVATAGVAALMQVCCVCCWSAGR